MDNPSKYTAQYDSPIGPLSIEGSNDGISKIAFVLLRPDPSKFISEDRTPNRIIEQCVDELDEYFAGIRTMFSIPLDPQGTAFEQEVWRALCMIKYGSTCSYLDIARTINNPKAIRAVGRANGANPIVIVVPCHRIIGSDGSLTGYAGELWRKRWLLDHEARISGTVLL
ncbi:MAG TPA: methylated-DNA--[protein]-cysteine S-methyltransferase [Candidatus Kapabacteria bacterium]|jgi:methylated-DNA-[protein]-cysteine S-methyltransferase|nr:methylated-DNA--[protein]-cysteine S-methyltransferase [Candidatus Kapabacteria bacterium]